MTQHDTGDAGKKSAGMELALEQLFGRSTALAEGTCLAPPIGCGGPASEFRDELSAREYRVSGLCQACQDTVWG